MPKFITTIETEAIAFVKGFVYIASHRGVPMRVRCKTPTTFTGDLDSSGGFVYTFELSAFDWIMELPIL